MGSTTFDPSTTIGAALQSLDLLEQDTDHVHILGSSLNQEYDTGGELFDTVEIYWSLYGRPGVFTTRVFWDINWLAQAYFQIGMKAAMVQRIYEGWPDRNTMPPGVAGPPPFEPIQATAPPGTAIAL